LEAALGETLVGGALRLEAGLRETGVVGTGGLEIIRGLLETSLGESLIIGGGGVLKTSLREALVGGGCIIESALRETLIGGWLEARLVESGVVVDGLRGPTGVGEGFETHCFLLFGGFEVCHFCVGMEYSDGGWRI
jgi:hypothetical protein